MKKVLAVLVVLAVMVPLSLFAKDYDAVQMIEGRPNKPYIEVGMVWAEHRKAEKAMKKVKKQAYKLGADAVINYQINAPIVYGWAVKWSSPAEAKAALESADMPIIMGEPKRLYTEIGPIWKSHTNVNTALKRLKKAARKKGADAIIEFKIGAKNQVRGFHEPNLNMFFQSNKITPVVQGIAVKWNN